MAVSPGAMKWPPRSYPPGSNPIERHRAVPKSTTTHRLAQSGARAATAFAQGSGPDSPLVQDSQWPDRAPEFWGVNSRQGRFQRRSTELANDRCGRGTTLQQAAPLPAVARGASELRDEPCGPIRSTSGGRQNRPVGLRRLEVRQALDACSSCRCRKGGFIFSSVNIPSQ